MNVHASLAPDRSGVLLAGEQPTEIARWLRSLTPPVQPRRRLGAVCVDFAAASHLRDIATVRWDSTAARAVDNRAHVQRVATQVLDKVRRIKNEGPAAARARLDGSRLASALDDHQAINVAVMTVAGGWGAAVFDEQGTGKTPTTIAAFDLLVERNEADQLLVVAPKSMVREWAEEFARFTGDLYRVAVVDGPRAAKASAIDSGADVIVCNYETATTMLENLRVLARRSRLVLAVDESFNVKNPDAQRTGAIADVREWCTRAFVLCGTPAPNDPTDVVAQFDLIDFGVAFGGVRLSDDVESRRREIATAMSERGVFVRSLKRSVLPHLPGRQFTEVMVELAPQQRAAYEGALNDLIVDLNATSDNEFRHRVASFLERRSALLRICSNPSPLIAGYVETPAKLAALDALLAELIEDRNEKVVVWSFYRASLAAIEDRYGRYGTVRVDGDVPSSERRRAIARFQHDEGTRVFVGNPAAAGAGLTLHRARVAVYESFSNQAAHFLQSLDRIHRRGQERPVEYLALLCRGTVEEAEYARLLEKADSQADLLGDPQQQRVTREMMLEELTESRRLLDFVDA